MGSMLKNLRKSVNNLRFGMLNNSNREKQKQGFLLKRICGGHLEDTPYFCALSAEDLSPTRQIYSHLLEEFKVVLGSCNGLLCLDNTTKESLLWNPSTDESKIIPSDAMRLWSPSVRKHCFAGGFGYDSHSHDFKLIRFIYSFGRDHSQEDSDVFVFDGYQTELYSLRTDSWKPIAHPGYFVLRNPSVYLDGCCYWLAYDDREQFLLAFHFATDELTSHSLPPDVVATTFGFAPPILDFIDFQGSLGLLVFPRLGAEKTFHLWLTDGQYWTKQSEFSVAAVERPLGFWGRLLFFEGLDRQLMAYHIDTRETKKLCVYDFPRKMQLVPYVETNVSIQGLSGPNN